MVEIIKDLEGLFLFTKKLKVPSYQRAYAWEELQLNQFVSDIHEMKNKEGYYFGHFILEEANDTFEIIDGQQRLTTFILFLMACRLFQTESFDNYINRFKTVNYDENSFETIKKKLFNKDVKWIVEDFELTVEPTLSIHRIVFALNYFINLFNEKKSKLKLDPSEINNYVKIFTKAHISTHITCSKDVAVQIFELQNTRGIKLNLIEKVKSKLMKAVYLNASQERKDDIISCVQENFAEIYHLEETASSNAFRGELTLDDILFHHIRIVDDGSKLITNDKNVFNSPSKRGNKEELILNYLQEQISSKSPQLAVEYIKNLSNFFKKSVQLVSQELPRLDEQNRLVGDVLILDKNLSLEFFILLQHKKILHNIEKQLVFKLWEKLLFTRDFHDKYYRLWYTDDFEQLFYRIAHEDQIEDVLREFTDNGFRPDSMEDRKLQLTVLTFIKNNKANILNNAFHWLREKMFYTLYKYEIEQGADLEELRKIMKDGRSVEHILPREWQWEWIGEKDPTNISENGNQLKENLDQIINGIGNLLLITASENSSLSNIHPKEKYYKSCSNGSYKFHNDNKIHWEDHYHWEKLIKERGENIYKFLENFLN